MGLRIHFANIALLDLINCLQAANLVDLQKTKKQRHVRSDRRDELCKKALLKISRNSLIAETAKLGSFSNNVAGLQSTNCF